jgi:hydrogenase/urease accessory protein HupE
MKKKWGVVQLVGHLTVNAPEAIMHGQARGRSIVKIASVHAYSTSFQFGTAQHQGRNEQKSQLTPELTPLRLLFLTKCGGRYRESDL